MLYVCLFIIGALIYLVSLGLAYATRGEPSSMLHQIAVIGAIVGPVMMIGTTILVKVLS